MVDLSGLVTSRNQIGQRSCSIIQAMIIGGLGNGDKVHNSYSIRRTELSICFPSLYYSHLETMVLVENYIEFEDTQLKTIERLIQLERAFADEQIQLNLFKSNLKFFSILASVREGSNNCWKRGYLFDEEVRN